MALATSIAGCQFAAERPSPEVPASDHTEGQVTLHQAGQVLAGTPIVHAFQFQNSTNRKLRLVDQDDVRPSCGCAHARVIDYELEPGASTAVTVRVQTEGRQGPLAEAVSVTWTSETGQRWEHVFAIRGQVRSALRFTPGELWFDRSEVARAVRKQVSCTSDLPIDWRSAVVQVAAPCVEVENQHLAADGQTLLFDVVCHPAGTGDSRQAVIRLDVDGAGLGDSPPLQAFSAQLPVYAADSTALNIAPRTASLRLKSEGAPWMGQLIVTGDAVAAGADVRRVNCPSGRIGYRSTRIAASALKVELNWWPDAADAVPGEQEIEMQLTSGETARTTLRTR